MTLLLQLHEIPLQRPKHFDDSNWSGLLLEHSRFQRAVQAGDLGDVVGTLKTMIESISKTVLELGGEPPSSNAKFPKIFQSAHSRLIDQPIEGKSIKGPSRNILEQSRKMILALDEVRNESGSGHGRTLLPELNTDTVEMLTAVAFSWLLWALPRIDKYADGRPDVLIRDLIVVNRTFTRGHLVNRLKNANLAKLPLARQREIGLAVARRGMQGTFVVWQDGVEDCSESDSIEEWPIGYREGLFQGLFTDKRGRFHATPISIYNGLLAIDPVPDVENLVRNVLDQCNLSSPLKFNEFWADAAQLDEVEAAFTQQIDHRKGKQSKELTLLKGALGLPPF